MKNNGGGRRRREREPACRQQFRPGLYQRREDRKEGWVGRTSVTLQHSFEEVLARLAGKPVNQGVTPEQAWPDLGTPAVLRDSKASV